jgi:DUF4097 and DUF4098 domain-containing protein YvlB
MASPTQVPPPRHRRSISGPVVLVILGIIFLMGTMGYLSWGMLGHLFAHYWPAILILAGIIKLIEYQAAQRTGTRASGIGAGGVILILLLIGIGLAATQASRFNWGELRDQIDIDDDDFTLFGHNYSYQDELSQAFPAGASLHITDTRGNVNINAADGDQISVAVRKRINAETQSEADRWNNQTKPQLTVAGNVVTLDANNHGAGDHGVVADLDISLPRKASVVVSSRGDIVINQRDGDVQANDQHGDFSASDVNGKVTLNLDHSSARLSQIANDVAIDGRANDVSLDDIKGAVHLDGEFMESVKLSKIAKPVMFRSSRTDMEFTRLDGDLNLDSGDLQASGITGPVRLNTRSKDISLTGVSGDVRLEDENGSVELRMNKLGSMQVEDRKGDIQLYLPDKAGFQLDARASNGDIESDFNELKVDNSHDRTTATGTVGGGGPRVVINNEHGDIALRKASSAPEEAPKPPTPPRVPHGPTPPSPPKVTEN